MKIIINESVKDLEYSEICKILGYNPSTHFVKVTSTGRISFTLGRPNEIRDLYASVIENGFVPSRNLLSRIKNL